MNSEFDGEDSYRARNLKFKDLGKAFAVDGGVLYGDTFFLLVMGKKFDMQRDVRSYPESIQMNFVLKTAN
jgi:hypothetical protein